MRAMGHRSPITTARYSEFADSERRWAFARADITKGIRLPGLAAANSLSQAVRLEQQTRSAALGATLGKRP